MVVIRPVSTADVDQLLDLANLAGVGLTTLPKDRDLLVHCAGGYRSSIAASLLQRRGFHVTELAGGLAAWESARLPLERG